MAEACEVAVVCYHDAASIHINARGLCTCCKTFLKAFGHTTGESHGCFAIVCCQSSYLSIPFYN